MSKFVSYMFIALQFGSWSSIIILSPLLLVFFRRGGTIKGLKFNRYMLSSIFQLDSFIIILPDSYPSHQKRFYLRNNMTLLIFQADSIYDIIADTSYI